jgi:inorganic pyrophosphatase
MDIKKYLGNNVSVIIDRPLGTIHPTYGFTYTVNYGYIADTMSPDGEGLDAYVLGVSKPLEEFTGKCIAIIHRTDDDDDKLVIVPDGLTISDEEIEKLVAFQEKWFKHKLIRYNKL